MEATYKIQGMTCQGCVRSVTSAIQRIDPGLTVEVSLEEGIAKVRGQAGDAAVKEAVEGAGFDFGGRVGPP